MSATTPKPPQLQMVWPENLLDKPPVVGALPAGYDLICWRPRLSEAYVRLMNRAGFDGWDVAQAEETFRTALPNGIFLAVHRASGVPAATAAAQHHPQPDHPGGGVLGWVAADPDHRGQGLGRVVCAAAVSRLLQGRYRDISLKTDDWRLAAIKIYLDLGFTPHRYDEGMTVRWQSVLEQLGCGPA